MAAVLVENVETVLLSNGFLEIRFNKAPKFNCIDTNMLIAISTALSEYVDGVNGLLCVGIIFCAVAGPAFCSGADIKHIASLSPQEKIDFLYLEYMIQHRIFVASMDLGIPVIGIADGIVMGAGAGIWMSTNIRIVTERTLFAMPEANIGLVPDAGAHYFLRKKCPPNYGLYLALTGRRLEFAELIELNLATHYIPPSTVSFDSAKLLSAIHSLDTSVAPSVDIVNELLKGRFDAITQMEVNSDLALMKSVVDNAFDLHRRSSLEDVILVLEEVAEANSGWAEKAKQFSTETLASIRLTTESENTKTSCPASLFATFKGMMVLHSFDASQETETAKETVEMARAVELLLNGWMLNRADFEEGVSCAVGSKKGSVPKWNPSHYVDTFQVASTSTGSEQCSTLNWSQLHPAEIPSELNSALKTLHTQQHLLTLDSARQVLYQNYQFK